MRCSTARASPLISGFGWPGFPRAERDRDKASDAATDQDSEKCHNSQLHRCLQRHWLNGCTGNLSSLTRAVAAASSVLTIGSAARLNLSEAILQRTLSHRKWVGGLR